MPPPLPNRWNAEPISGSVSFGAVIENLLKTPGRILHECVSGSRKVPLFMFLVSVGCLAVFGFLLGTFSGGEQLWQAPAKVLLGTFAAMLICLPSLYIFSALDGVDVRLPHVLGLLVAAMTLASLLLLGFAPVIWVFSQSSDALPFMGTLALIFWLIGLTFGLRLLVAAGAYLRSQGGGYLKTWIAIFVVVTLQMSTALRPIIGTATTFLPAEKKFFVQHWLEEMGSKSTGRD